MRPVLRDWSFKGSVLADGLLIPRLPGGEDQARNRVLRAWRPGASVSALRGFYLLSFPVPQRLRAEHALGYPVCKAGSVLTTVPLDQTALRELAAPVGALLTLEAGRLRIAPAEERTPVSPAAWLAIMDFDVAVLSDLGPATVPPRATVRVVEGDVRSALGKAIPPQDARTAALLEAARAHADAAGRTIAPLRGDRSAAGGSGIPLLSRLGRWLAGLVPAGTGGAGRAGRPVPGGRSAGAGTNRSAGTRRRRTGPSLWNRLSGLFAQAAVRADLANLIGRRQARYLMETLRLFEQNRIEEALKRAISLSKSSPAGGRPALGVPSIRESLRIGARTAGQTFAMRLPPQVYQVFETTYREQARKLEAAGQLEQAAFILAELLEQPEEAVALLERAGKLKEAARVAEVRQLPASRAVRLWFLAGERERAVKLAVRHNAFEDAVTRLQADDPDKAAPLIALWAQHLAEAGDLRAAVWTALPRPELADRVETWIDQVLQPEGGGAGTELAAEMLSLKLRLQPEAWPALAPEVDAIAAAPGPLGRRRRLRFLQCAFGTSAGTLQPLALRPVIRALLAELDGLSKTARSSLELALKQCGDTTLQIDTDTLLREAKAVKSPEPRPATQAAMEPVVIAADDTGRRGLQDAAVLPGGRALVALGEAGVLICGPEGQVQTRFACPAHRLVVSDAGTRAIALAQRGELWRLTRLDLITRTARDWTEVPLEGFADSYDGASWLVVQNRSLLAIDCTEAGFGYLWDVSNIDGSVIALGRDAQRACFLLRQPRSLEIWSIDLKTLRLDVWEPKANTIPAANDWLAAAVGPYRFVCAVAANREVWDPEWFHPDRDGTSVRALPVDQQQLWRYRSDDERQRLAAGDHTQAMPARPLADPSAWSVAGPYGAAAGRSWFATVSQSPESKHGVSRPNQLSRPQRVCVDLEICRIAPMMPIARYRIDAVGKTKLRFQGDLICYCDDRGRLLAFHTDEPEEVMNWRL